MDGVVSIAMSVATAAAILIVDAIGKKRRLFGGVVLAIAVDVSIARA